MTFEHLPKYKCHKVVRAFKITQIDFNLSGDAVIFGEHDGVEFLEVPKYEEKYKGSKSNLDQSDKGYFVLYEDGYISWSPTKAFEDGYSKIEECNEDIKPDGIENTVMGMGSRSIKVALINGNMPDKNGRKYDLTKIDLTSLPKNVVRIEIKDNVLFGELEISEEEYQQLFKNKGKV